MYLWVIIATFITILYSYNISVRADLDRVHAETKAGVAVTKFFAQHNAVKDYFNSKATSKTGHTAVSYFPGDGFNSTFCAKGTTLEDCSISEEDLKPYLPVGYSLDADVVSKVYCFNDGDKSHWCTTYDYVSCCSNEFAGIYVISYAPIPQRLRNISTYMPNADLLGYMAKTRGFGKSFGYTYYKNGELILSGGYMAKNYDNFTGGGLEAELPEGGLDTEMPGVSIGDGLSGSNPTAYAPHSVTAPEVEIPEGGLDGALELVGGDSQVKQEFQYHKIFEAVRQDRDFKKLGCYNRYNPCFYAIQQIYD